ncbi:unnamed protein product [Lupinus luteus]|uniref:Uncharacterized protein n=1 Tax=Lupinus luteus TaxID=3873 RepID=A0AAV1X252_LUPLU
MGFPVGYTEVCFPNLFLKTLTLLGFLRNLVFVLFHYIGISEFLETDVVWSEPNNNNLQISDIRKPSVDAILIREFLPAIKFSDLDCSCAAVSGCAVCLYEFSDEDEIRTPLVPDDMVDEYNQRLWTAFDATEFYAE